jgi:hypothetical protein
MSKDDLGLLQENIFLGSTYFTNSFHHIATIFGLGYLSIDNLSFFFTLYTVTQHYTITHDNIFLHKIYFLFALDFSKI